MDRDDRTARNELFQKLKPHCIQLSQLALKDDSSSDGLKALRASTSKLFEVLQQSCYQSNAVFDNKLADYVFFPLSHVLKKCQKSPGPLAEVALQCVNLLLLFGWQKSIPLDLATQLLLLLTYFAGGGGIRNVVISEELKTEAFTSLAALFEAIRSTPKGSASLTETSMIPALGHCLVTVLDGATAGPTSQCQVAALQALSSLWSCVKDLEALSTFLPGTISSLTKTLLPTTNAPRSRKVLISAINVFQSVITTCLSDVRTRNLPDNGPDEETAKATTLTKSWLKATGSQIKLALTNIVKLRNHEGQDVRTALSATCIVLLDETHHSLSEAAPLLVETVMSISSSDCDPIYSQSTSLKDLAIIHDSIRELIKTTIYGWATSFPRIMQSNEEAPKRVAMQQIHRAYNLVSELSMDSVILENAIGDSLRDGVSALIEVTAPKSMVTDTMGLKFDDSPILARDDMAGQNFRSVIMPQESQIQTRQQLEQLLEGLGTPEVQLRMAMKILPQQELYTSTHLLPSLWLSFQLLKASTSASKVVDEFLATTISSADERFQVIEELYDTSLNLLSEEETTDWRLQAISLEIVTYKAQFLGKDFRLDLIDALYPIVQMLGSSSPELREHAIACLNLVSSSCGYGSTSAMITENVDYLVNAVSLKLNTFNVTPRAPQVLVMMIKLSGPSLLPYLDDVVGSIFAALDNFHGYPRVVEMLFSVLGEIVNEGSRSNQLRLAMGEHINHRKKLPRATKVSDVVDIMRRRQIQSAAQQNNEHRDFPTQPWKSAKTLLDEHNPTDDDSEPEEAQSLQEEVRLPPPKLYSMVQSIVHSSQHHLTNDSPLLRRRLLELIGTACEALHTSEDQFLPLINDIWPVIVKRLYDEEMFVAVAASNAIAELCRRAGDFLATRLQSEWLELMNLFNEAKIRALAEKQGRHSRGIYAQRWQVWEGFISLLLAIVQHVRINDDMFDRVLELLGDLLITREDLRTALCFVNADAVWLEEVRRGRSLGDVPRLEGYTFACNI